MVSANDKLQMWRNASTGTNVSWVDNNGNWDILGDLTVGGDIYANIIGDWNGSSDFVPYTGATSNLVGKKLGLEVWEFVTHRIDNLGKSVRTFLDEGEMAEVENYVFTGEESILKERLSLLYDTQKEILDKFKAEMETLGRRKKFDSKTIPNTEYYYGDRKGHPSCQEIRDIMTGEVI